jgi:hypothetical protein
MKHALRIALAIALSVNALVAQETDGKAVIRQREDIVVLGSNNRNQWLVKLSNPTPTIALMDINSHKMYQIPIEEDGILSAQFIALPYMRESVIEVVGCSTQGKGNLYLFNSNLVVLLKTPYFDSHREKLPYERYHSLKAFMKRQNQAETISRVYRDSHLQVDYRDTRTKTVKVTGYCDYVADGEDGSVTILTEAVEKFFQYSDTKKAFEYVGNISLPENPSWVE